MTPTDAEPILVFLRDRVKLLEKIYRSYDDGDQCNARNRSDTELRLREARATLVAIEVLVDATRGAKP